MSYKVNDMELQSVLKLSGRQRYHYFIGKIVDWRELWSVGRGVEWALMRDDAGNVLIPVWPAERYAALCCTGEWLGYTPKPVTIDDWMHKWFQGMISDCRRVVVFPIPDNLGVVVDPRQLQLDIETALSNYV